MNVFYFYTLLLLILTGCTPASVSLNAEFGLSFDPLKTSPDQIQPPKPQGSMSIAQSPAHININNRSTFDLEGTCQNVERIQVKIDSVSLAEIDCTHQQWQTRLDLTSLAEGNITLNFIDISNNESLHKLTLEKDTIAPIAMILNPPPAVNNWDDFTIAFDLTSGLSQFSYKFGIANMVNCSSPADYSTYLNFQVGISIDLSTYSSEEMRLCLLGKDLFENEQSYTAATTINWIRDVQGPTLGLHSTTHSTYANIVNHTAFTVQATCSENDRPIHFMARNSGAELSDNTIVCTLGLASKTFNLATLPDGNIQFIVAQTDAAGTTTEAVILTIYKDTIEPVFANTAINDGTFYSSLKDSPTISWSSATDSGSGVDFYKIGIGTSPGSPDTVGFQSPLYTPSYQYINPNPKFTEGTRYYTIVQAYDRAGNKNTLYGDGWIPDITGPTLTSINYDKLSSVGETPLISWPTATDNAIGSGVHSYRVSIGTSPGNSNILGWSDVGPTTTFKTLASGITINGTYFVSLQAKDNAGNYGMAITGAMPFTAKNLITNNVVSNSGAYAAILKTGKVITWGDDSFGGNYTLMPTTLKSGTRTATSLATTYSAFAAIMDDGSVVAWGDSSRGGEVPTNKAIQMNGTIDVTHIASNKYAFAAILQDGSVAAWGDSNRGGGTTAVDAALNGDIDVSEIKATSTAFAARRTDGSVIAWGHPDTGGTIPPALLSALDGTIPVNQLHSTGTAFIAQRADGSLISWGDSTSNLRFSMVANQLDGTIKVIKVVTNNNATAALRADGSVVTWGESGYGGNSTAVAADLNGAVDVSQLVSSGRAFAALRTDNTVIAWNDTDYGGAITAATASLLASGGHTIDQIFSTYYAFAALKSNGSVVTWGNNGYGGNSTAVASHINGTIKVTTIYSNRSAFAALRTDGSVVKWGDSVNGGDPTEKAAELTGSPKKVTQIFSNDFSFTALRDDGTFVTWGTVEFGGDSSSVNP
ncbi:MAG: hypothetical protein JNL11_07455 [Bdellovibrionaceae bacterium]|nr:hypothetical protein [Pseudobdellovibrionaceae bacterium]